MHSGCVVFTRPWMVDRFPAHYLRGPTLSVPIPRSAANLIPGDAILHLTILIRHLTLVAALVVADMTVPGTAVVLYRRLRSSGLSN